MATVRYYINNAAAPYSPSTYHGNWDGTASVGSRQISVDKVGTLATGNPDIGSTSANYRRLGMRVVSTVLAANKRVTLLNYCIGCKEEHVDANAVSGVYAYVTIGDSDNERGRLVNNWTGSTEWVVGSNNCGLAETPTSYGYVDALANDRLVVEFGTSSSSAATDYYILLMRGLTSGTDLVQGGDATTGPSWVDFDLSDPPATGCPKMTDFYARLRG